MTASEIGTTVLTALLGGSGAAGLLTWAVKRWAADRSLRSAAEQTRRDEARKKIDYLVEHGKRVDDALRDMAAENTLQCYCLLACLRGLEEQGCDGPVHDGINRLEKYLNQKAHGGRP